MSNAPTPAEEGQAEAAPKKSKKLLIIIVAGLLVAGGAGGFIYKRRAAAETTAKDAKTSKKESAAKRAAEEEDEPDAEAEADTPAGEKGKGTGKGEDKEAKPKKDPMSTTALVNLSLPDDDEVKHIIELQPFIVNLADTEESRYLRLTVSVGLGESENGEKTDPLFTTRVRNAILAVLTTKTSEEVLTVEGKTKLRKEILKAAQKASTEPKVIAIYITDFIVQM